VRRYIRSDYVNNREIYAHELVHVTQYEKLDGRGQIAKEFWQVLTKYIDFGKWYEGHKKRKTRS